MEIRLYREPSACTTNYSWPKTDGTCRKLIDCVMSEHKKPLPKAQSSFLKPQHQHQPPPSTQHHFQYNNKEPITNPLYSTTFNTNSPSQSPDPVAMSKSHRSCHGRGHDTSHILGGAFRARRDPQTGIYTDHWMDADGYAGTTQYFRPGEDQDSIPEILGRRIAGLEGRMPMESFVEEGLRMRCQRGGRIGMLIWRITMVCGWVWGTGVDLKEGIMRMAVAMAMGAADTAISMAGAATSILVMGGIRTIMAWVMGGMSLDMIVGLEDMVITLVAAGTDYFGGEEYDDYYGGYDGYNDYYGYGGGTPGFNGYGYRRNM
ncbi:hypothetical protein J1614_008782 [Plenodomus biglobosus]|nr:hypothetical protein J1614_008782 [Plenodomus biglobosus]